MAAGAVPFSHTGFTGRAQAARSVISHQGISENIAFNNFDRYRTAAVAVEGWIRSSGHRANIEGRYDVTGIGIARSTDGTYYFTQIFVRR